MDKKKKERRSTPKRTLINRGTGRGVQASGWARDPTSKPGGGQKLRILAGRQVIGATKQIKATSNGGSAGATELRTKVAGDIQNTTKKGGLYTQQKKNTWHLSVRGGGQTDCSLEMNNGGLNCFF